MWLKLLRTAGLGPADIPTIPYPCPKIDLWRAIRTARPAVLIALGRPAARLLLRGDSAFSLAAVAGRPHPVDYLGGGVVVPMYDPAYLQGRGVDLVKDSVATLRLCKRLAADHARIP